MDYASPGGRRAEAERLLDLLIKDKRIEVVEDWVNRNKVEFIVPKEPEELVSAPPELAPPSFPPHPGRGVANGFLGGRRFGFEGIVWINRISKNI